MGKPKQKISEAIETPLLGYLVVVLALACFLVALAVLMTLTRALVA